MKIDDIILTKLEKLSSISIKDEKKEQMKESLSEIVNFVENLNELNLEGKDPSFTTLDTGTPFRDDIPVKNEETIEIILKNAPEREERFFVVPKIIE